MFEKVLDKRGYSLLAKYSVKMVDTYIPLFKIPDLEKQKEILLEADKQLDEIKLNISENKTGDFEGRDKGFSPWLITKFAYLLYKYGRSTKKFYVTDDCIGCELCKNICSVSAINIQEGNPIWEKAGYELCFACLHHYPKTAMQYGSNSERAADM